MTDAATKKAIRRANAARNFPVNTCSVSRHVETMARGLLHRAGYPMLTDEPEHCAQSMLGTVANLWEARAELAATLRRHDELRETLAVVGGERDSLRLRVQQLDADEDRLDWLDEAADYNTFDALLRLLDGTDGLREAIDVLRGAKP